MTVRYCEACATPILDPEPKRLPLCDLCMATVDEDTELLLESWYFDSPDCE
jgi:hypothetical protein